MVPPIPSCNGRSARLPMAPVCLGLSAPATRSPGLTAEVCVSVPGQRRRTPAEKAPQEISSHSVPKSTSAALSPSALQSNTAVFGGVRVWLQSKPSQRRSVAQRVPPKAVWREKCAGGLGLDLSRTLLRGVEESEEEELKAAGGGGGGILAGAGTGADWA